MASVSLLLLALLVVSTEQGGSVPARAVVHNPSIQDSITKERFAGEAPSISPSGEYVVYTTRQANWADNTWQSTSFINPVSGDDSDHYVIAGGVPNLRWIDNRTFAFLRDGDIWAGNCTDGHIHQATETGGIIQFELAGSEGYICLVELDDESNQKSTEPGPANVIRYEKEKPQRGVFYITCNNATRTAGDLVTGISDTTDILDNDLAERLTSDVWIQNFFLSPTGDAVYLNCLPVGSLNYWQETSIWRIPVAKLLVHGSDDSLPELKLADEPPPVYRCAIPPYMELAAMAPDGDRLLLASWGHDPRVFNRSRLHVATISPEGAIGIGPDLLANLDRQYLTVCWIDTGIYFSYWSGTRIGIAQVSTGGELHEVALRDVFPLRHFSLSQEGFIVFVGGSSSTLLEVYTGKIEADFELPALSRITDFNERYGDWNFGTVETISWLSTDGIEIEGVIRKPADFNPDRQYPLIFLAHGGPIWADLALLEDGSELSTYPVLQFLQNDVLVVKPNYRGSRGRGQDYAAAKCGTELGAASLRDFEGAVEHFTAMGSVDPSRVGCMGWSHGGYISAYLATHSRAFIAVSVGGGISDWRTYAVASSLSYEVASDYLGVRPFQDERGILQATSPLHGVTDNTAPMLLQHVEQDPISSSQSAKELYRALKEHQVPVEFYLFAGSGHGINTPVESHAVMRQNLDWFMHWFSNTTPEGRRWTNRQQ